MDVEEISDSESLEEITAEDFTRDSCKSRVSMPDLFNSPSPRSSLPVSSDFAWEEETVVIVDSSEEETEEGEIEEGETCLVSIEDNSEEAASEMEMKEAIIDLGLETQVAVEITAIANCESELKDSAMLLGEFDRRARLIREELESVNTDEAAASFESRCGRVRRSFDSLKQIYRESWVPIPNTLDQSIVISGTKKEKAGEFLLRTLNNIKNRHSYLLTTEQSQELDAMVRSLVGLDNKGSNTISPVSTIKLDGSCVTSAGVSTPLPDHHMVYDIGSLNCENAKPLPTQKPNGPGATVEGAFDAFLRCVPDASQAVSAYQHKYMPPFFLASNQRPSPNPSMNVHGNPHMYGGASSSLVGNNARAVNCPSPNPSMDVHGNPHMYGGASRSLVGNNARAVNYANSSFLPGHSSSSSCITSSNGLQSGPGKTVGQLVPGSTPAVIAVGNRDPRFRISNPEIARTYDHNRCQLPQDFSTHNGFSGGSMNSRRVDEPLMVANTLKRQRIQLTDSRMKPESNVLTSQSSNMNVRKHKAVEPLLGLNTLKRQKTSIADSSNVPMKPGVGGWSEERSVTSQPSNINVAVQPKRPRNGVVSNRMWNANSNTYVINDGTGQKLPMGAAPAVLLPPLLKGISVTPAILTQLLHNEQRRLGAKDQQKTEGVACDSRIIHNANVILPGTNSEYGASLKTSTKERNSAVNSQLPDQTVSMNTQNPPRISHSETKTNGNQNKEGIEIVRSQGELTHKNGLSSHPAQQPDIAQLVTDKLKDIVSTMSSLQSTITSLAATQNISQPIPNRMKEDVMPVTDDSDGQTVSGGPSKLGTLGVPQKPNPWGDVDHLLEGYEDQQKVSIQRERAKRIDEQNKMFAARKLSLVLDLDHTLLNSAKFTDVDPTLAEKLRKKEEIDRGKPRRHLFRFQHMGLWTKLRPGIWNFLERASKLFELHIYTMGNQMYATEIAKVLDPTGTLFAGRVISRGDDNPVDGFQMVVPKSKDLDGVLGLESGVVIIDDSLKVWPYNKQNLIVVERYTYFPCSRRQFGLSGPSLLEIDHDERVKDGTLASSLSVIERVHEKFFSHCNLNDVDVRNILSYEQRKILAGCRIVFSRIFPVEEANPHRHPLWQIAEQFGAVCTNQIDEQVTHVVANMRGTDKVTWALSTGRFVVQPGWVEASALLYRRAKEHEFVVKP